MRNDFVGINDLAKYLDVQESTIYNWVHTRKIPYYKVGRLVKFNRDEIGHWLKERKQEVVDHRSI
jgi:excisionase family DNA binding protein